MLGLLVQNHYVCFLVIDQRKLVLCLSGGVECFDVLSSSILATCRQLANCLKNFQVLCLEKVLYSQKVESLPLF